MIRSEGDNLHVYNELDKLCHVAVWGEPGCEAVLGQLLPLDVSLFWGAFDVASARVEYRQMQNLISEQGVKITRMKDAFLEDRSSHSSKLPSSAKELKEKLKEKGRQIHALYQRGDLRVLDLIDDIVDQDVDEYGEERALRLNTELSLKYSLPLANIFYGRDQSNVLGNRVIMSRMRWQIRKPEVRVLAQSYRQAGFKDELQFVLDGTLEGGDAMMLGKYCFIGVGVRTSREAVADIYRSIGYDLESRGIQIVAVVDEEMTNLRPKTAGEEMDAMHWDTWIAPINEQCVVANLTQVERRHIEFVTKGKDGVIEFIDSGSLCDFLKRSKIEVIPISDAEQKRYGTNFLHLGNGSVIVPLSDNTETNKGLERSGINVISAEVRHLSGGYGAVHCMTAALIRLANGK